MFASLFLAIASVMSPYGVCAHVTRGEDAEKTFELASAAGLMEEPAGFTGLRFFTGKYLHEGDRMIPVLTGTYSNKVWNAAVVYKFGSDWKGSIYVSSTRAGGVGGKAVFCDMYGEPVEAECRSGEYLVKVTDSPVYCRAAENSKIEIK